MSALPRLRRGFLWQIVVHNGAGWYTVELCFAILAPRAFHVECDAILGATEVPMESESVANYFLEKAFDTGVSISQMKLLKLVYIAHGWHRGCFGRNLIKEAVEAWQYGPVIPDLYAKVKHYGRGHINAPIPDHGIAGDRNNPFPHPQTGELLDQVWTSYRSYTAIQLSEITHRPGTPWDQVWNRSGGSVYEGAIIPNELIEFYYKQKINGQHEQGA